MIEIFDRKGFDRVVTIDSPTLAGVDLSGKDLTNGNFIQMDLQGANFSEANLTDTDFRLCNLQGANLSSANLNGADFSGANLIGAKLDNAQLENTKLTGTIISVASLAYLSKVDGVNLDELELSQDS